jgi:DNA-binding NtrC family response regulator
VKDRGPGKTVTRGDDEVTLSDHLCLLVAGDAVLATEPLPTAGMVTIGRAPTNDIRIDDESISRAHAVLEIGAQLVVRDRGSANGTWVGNQRLAADQGGSISADEPFRLGNVTLIVQRRAVRMPSRRLITHEEFERRVADEYAAALRHGSTFSLVHIVTPSRSDVLGFVNALLRDDDAVAAYGGAELEVLLVDELDQMSRVVQRLQAVIASRRLTASVGVATYPADGREIDGLAEVARSRARGRPELPPQHDNLVVVGEVMIALHELVTRVAQADISVLLLGETGVGKEVFAELIHRLSSRASRPFVRLNCAAFTETLLESELFGYERGAFTGATQAKPGLLETADGGVLFLDEVGEMHASTQAKLLRVLDEHKVLRLGALTPRPLDVRIVSATNRDLEAECKRGNFREDLLYRLNALSITIPPLRERKGEIEALATSFAQRYAARQGRAPTRITSDALTLLRNYSWPGNIRELRNVIERALVLCTGEAIDVGDLPVEKFRADAAAPVRPKPTAANENDERLQIVAALEACAGNQTHAAKYLGISRRALIKKLDRFGVARPRKR